jgi:DNA invertase Pin-like site-specific DNA recombinase
VERRIIGQRTKDALAEKRAEGVTLGRPIVLPQAVKERILAARSAGEGLSAIARALNADEVPTAHGGAKWHPSTVRAVARRFDVAQ